MRICITGIAGFIGSTLADRLEYMGHEVWGIDNYETGVHENLKAEMRMNVVEGTIAWALRRAHEELDLAPPELIIHCAAAYKDPDRWIHDSETNVIGASQVGLYAKDCNARIIYFQTVLPPISSYAISKIAGEHYLRLSGQPLTVFRLAAVYGPRNLSGAIPTFYRQVKAGLPCTVVEDASRDFVFVEDLVQQVMQRLDFQRSEVINVYTNRETRILEIPGMIGQLLETEAVMKLIPRPSHDVPHYDMDGIPLHEITPFAEGLKQAVEWYEANGVGETYTHLGVLDDESST